jgi:hypothetical protein
MISSQHILGTCSIGTIFAAGGLWSENMLDNATASIGTLLVVIATKGLYLSGLSMLATPWFLFGIAWLGLLLWKRSSEYNPNP